MVGEETGGMGLENWVFLNENEVYVVKLAVGWLWLKRILGEDMPQAID